VIARGLSEKSFALFAKVFSALAITRSIFTLLLSSQPCWEGARMANGKVFGGLHLFSKRGKVLPCSECKIWRTFERSEKVSSYLDTYRNNEIL
jgi:hypothetical protein